MLILEEGGWFKCHERGFPPHLVIMRTLAILIIQQSVHLVMLILALVTSLGGSTGSLQTAYNSIFFSQHFLHFNFIEFPPLLVLRPCPLDWPLLTHSGLTYPPRTKVLSDALQRRAFYLSLYHLSCSSQSFLVLQYLFNKHHVGLPLKLHH